MTLVQKIGFGAVAAALAAGCSDNGNGSNVCAQYDDAPAQASVMIRVRNTRATPIYLYEPCGLVYEVVAGGIAHQGHVVEGDYTCEMAKAGEMPCCDCPSEGREILPGGSWETEWQGLFHDQTQLPEQCLGAGATWTECQRAVAAPAGPLGIVVHGYATRKNCDLGYCELTDPLSGTADFVFGKDSTVEVVIGE